MSEIKCIAFLSLFLIEPFDIWVFFTREHMNVVERVANETNYFTNTLPVRDIHWYNAV